MFEKNTVQKIEGTVLLVDDDETVRNVGKELLENIGLRVITAEDGWQAVSIFKESPYSIDCIILDLSMPHMDGREAYAKLRPIRDDIPIFLSSGHSEHEVKQQFPGKKIAGFIQKPYQLSALAAELMKALRNTHQKPLS